MTKFDANLMKFITSYTEGIESGVDIAVLKLAVNSSNPELVELYKTQVETHNKSMVNDPFPNSGFDLFTPNEVVFTQDIVSKFVNLEVKTEMIFFNMKSEYSDNCGYYVHPRSSLSKTPLMLANHTGIIDSGYRGSLIGAFRWLSSKDDLQYVVEKHTRLLQICHPSLCRIFVYLVDESELASTVRGDGGFGSTGK